MSNLKKILVETQQDLNTNYRKKSSSNNYNVYSKEILTQEKDNNNNVNSNNNPSNTVLQRVSEFANEAISSLKQLVEISRTMESKFYQLEKELLDKNIEINDKDSEINFLREKEVKLMKIFYVLQKQGVDINNVVESFEKNNKEKSFFNSSAELLSILSQMNKLEFHNKLIGSNQSFNPNMITNLLTSADINFDDNLRFSENLGFNFNSNSGQFNNNFKKSKFVGGSLENLNEVNKIEEHTDDHTENSNNINVNYLNKNNRVSEIKFQKKENSEDTNDKNSQFTVYFEDLYKFKKYDISKLNIPKLDLENISVDLSSEQDEVKLETQSLRKDTFEHISNNCLIDANNDFDINNDPELLEYLATGELNNVQIANVLSPEAEDRLKEIEAFLSPNTDISPKASLKINNANYLANKDNKKIADNFTESNYTNKVTNSDKNRYTYLENTREIEKANYESNNIISPETIINNNNNNIEITSPKNANASPIYIPKPINIKKLKLDEANLNLGYKNKTIEPVGLEKENDIYNNSNRSIKEEDSKNLGFIERFSRYKPENKFKKSHTIKSKDKVCDVKQFNSAIKQKKEFSNEKNYLNSAQKPKIKSFNDEFNEMYNEFSETWREGIRKRTNKE